MNIRRVVRHLLMTHWQVNRLFPRDALLAIRRAIKASEANHSGEIRVAIEGALDSKPLFQGQTARERAIEVFAQQRLWDTEGHSGVLIYLLLADRDAEIVADRGLSSKVGTRQWESICRKMESFFKQDNYELGVLDGIHGVTRHLTAHIPVADGNRSVLPDKSGLA